MPTAVQMNTRIDKTLKLVGDEVLRKNGYSPSSAVQALWKYISENNSLPSFMPPKTKAEDKVELQEEISSNIGIASKLFTAQTGIILSIEDETLSDNELREIEWESRGAFDE